MATVSKNEINKEQIKLNLAINYMVIERVLRCMGIYNTVCDVHEGLDGIFVNARNRSLLDNLVNLGEEGVEIYIEKYQELFGLSYAVLLGQEQIQLGIDIKDMDIPNEYKKLLYTKTSIVTEFTKSNNLSTLKFYEYINKKESRGLNQELSKREDFLGQKIGTVDIKIDGKDDKEKTNKTNQLLNQLQYNPLGINTAGLFVMLFKEGHIKVYTEGKDKKEIQRPYDMKKPTDKSSEQYKKLYSDNEKMHARYWNKVNKLFGSVFCNSTGTFWTNKAGNVVTSVNYKDNIYSLDSIIYSILRYLHQDGVDIVGGELGSTKYQILDIKGEALTYPLKFVDEITYPISIKEKNYQELYKESDLLVLMLKLMHNGYMVADRKLELITKSSIEKEIKRHKEKINYIENQDNIEIDDGNALSNKTIEYIEHINNLAILEDQKKLFETDTKQWIEQYRHELDNEQKLLEEQFQLLDADININKNCTENIIKLKRLKNRINLIEDRRKAVDIAEDDILKKAPRIIENYNNARQEMANAIKRKNEAAESKNKANQIGDGKAIEEAKNNLEKMDKELKKAEQVFRKAKSDLRRIKPLILVKEPYYEEFGLEDYGVRGTCDTAVKKKGAKKNSKKQTKKIKETK